MNLFERNFTTIYLLFKAYFSFYLNSERLFELLFSAKSESLSRGLKDKATESRALGNGAVFEQYRKKEDFGSGTDRPTGIASFHRTTIGKNTSNGGCHREVKSRKH